MKRAKRLANACSVGRWEFDEGEEREVPDLVAAGLINDPEWEVDSGGPPIQVPVPKIAREKSEALTGEEESDNG